MNINSVITADFLSALFLTIILISIATRKNTKNTRSSKVLLFVTALNSLCCIAEGFACFTYEITLPNFLVYILWFITYLVGTVALGFYVYFCHKFIQEIVPVKRVVFLIPEITLILVEIYSIVLFFAGKVVKVTNGISTEIYGLPAITRVTQLVVIIYLSIVALHHVKRIGWYYSILLGSFGYLPMIASMYTMLTNGTDYSYSVCALALTIIHTLVLNKHELEKTETYNEFLLDMNNILDERLNIIQSMGSIYYASYYIDLDKNSFYELKALKDIRDVVNNEGAAQETLYLAVDKLIEPESKEDMKEFFDLSTIQERLSNKNAVSQKFVGTLTGWSLAYFIAGDRDKDGKLRHIFYACRTIHDEKEKEEAQAKKLEEYNNIISNAGFGIWTITLKDGEKPTMEANAKMKQLLGVENNKLSPEELYDWWYSRIVKEAIPSVEKSVQEMMDSKFSENTYLWNHPTEGYIYVRCGGTSSRDKNGAVILKGYHADVTHIVMQEAIQRRAQELETNQKQMSQLNATLLGALGTVVEFRSLESGDHVKRVMNFTQILLQQVQKDCPKYKLTDEQIEMISQAAALHDVGKIAIADNILEAPRKLTPEEFEEMKKHTTYGCEILEKFKFAETDFYKYSYDICRWHHEKVDGKGYPDGLKGDEIPIYCQVTSVADCFDALVSKRVYKDAITSDEAFNMILNGECGQFSEELMECFQTAKPRILELVAASKE